MPLLSDSSSTTTTITATTNTRSWLSTMVTNKIGYQIANQAEIHGHRLLAELELEALIQVLELAARDLHKNPARPAMMVIARLGLMIALQAETHSSQETVTQAPSHPIQVLVLSAKVSIRRNFRAELNMMVINKTGLRLVIQLKIHGLRRTQVEQELSRMRRLEVHSQASELNAKVSPKRRASQATMVTAKLGLMIAHQAETHSFQATEMQELLELIQESVLNARDSTRKTPKNWLSMMEIVRLGLMTAPQEETHGFKPMAKQEPEAPIQELVLTAKVLLKRR